MSQFSQIIKKLCCSLFIMSIFLAICPVSTIDMSGFAFIFVDCWALLLRCVFLFVYHLLGLLWLLLQQRDAVSVLMNSPSSQIMCSESQDSSTNDSQKLIQSQERSPDHCPLPLLLKKVSVQTSCTSTQHPHSASDDNPGLMCLWIGIREGLHWTNICATCLGNQCRDYI